MKCIIIWTRLLSVILFVNWIAAPEKGKIDIIQNIPLTINIILLHSPHSTDSAHLNTYCLLELVRWHSVL